MQKFLYKAWNKNFEIVKGSIEEDTISNATVKLHSQGLTIIDIHQYKSFFKFNILNKQLKAEYLSNFCGQLAIILNSGLNIINGLTLLHQQTKSKKMKKIISDISVGIKRGKTLAESIDNTHVFPKLLVNMVSAGEISGEIDTLLLNLQTLYEREADIKNKLKSASIYPILLIFISFGMIIFFNYFVFSEIKSLFINSKNLPLITKLLITFINGFNNYLPQIIILIALIIIFIKYVKTITKVKYLIDKINLKLPIISTVKNNILIARFTRSMGLFLKSAVPIIYTLDNLKLLINNRYISKKIDNIKAEIINGATISDAMNNHKIFDPLVIQMIKVGEETGKLEETLFKLADIYDKKSKNSIEKLISLVEPVFTLLVGIFVGIILLAIALPVMQMSNQFK